MITILEMRENCFGDSHTQKVQLWMVENYNKTLKMLLKYLKSFGIVGLIKCQSLIYLVCFTTYETNILITDYIISEK